MPTSIGRAAKRRPPALSTLIAALTSAIAPIVTCAAEPDAASTRRRPRARCWSTRAGRSSPSRARGPTTRCPRAEIVGFDFSSTASRIFGSRSRGLRGRPDRRSAATCTAAGAPITTRSAPTSSATRIRARCTTASRARPGFDYWAVARLRLRRQRLLGDRRRADAGRRATTRSRAASAAPSSARRCSACRTWCSSRAAACRRSGARSRPRAIAPSAGFNRLVFGDRYGAIFSSNGAELLQPPAARLRHSVRERASATRRPTSSATRRWSTSRSTTACPASNGYEYTRPFDYFSFQATASSANGFENVLTRGLLIGKDYEAGPDYRGVWGIYGSYDYIAPQTFRVSSTALSLGTTGAVVAAPTTSRCRARRMAGIGYAAVGTTHGTAATATTTTASRRRPCWPCA